MGLKPNLTDCKYKLRIQQMKGFWVSGRRLNKSEISITHLLLQLLTIVSKLVSLITSLRVA